MPKPVLLVFLFILAFIGFNSFFIVDQRESALVLQFGEPVSVKTEPGLKFKIPLVQNVTFFDKRILDLNAEPREVIASDQKRLIVDAFAKYKIIDPLLYFQSVKRETTAKDRLNSVLDSSMRQVLGSYPLLTLLSGQRRELMKSILEIVNQQAKTFGIDVVDVRIMRADLPAQNSEAVYRRMQTEREREAKEFRAQGVEEAQKITSTADKERRIILADAEKQGQIIRGEGDAIATKIFGDAFGKDPDFFAFYRSLQSYRKALKSQDTTLILSPDSDFLRYFNSLKTQ